MIQPNFIILYVEQPELSAAFYQRLFERAPVEASPGFVLFAFDHGLKFGLWAKATVEPPVLLAAGGSEIAFCLPKPEAVAACFAQWRAFDLTVLQPLTNMDFGYTFTVADPDGHRLRVFSPEKMA